MTYPSNAPRPLAEAAFVIVQVRRAEGPAASSGTVRPLGVGVGVGAAVVGAGLLDAVADAVAAAVVVG
ncbi:hypothetical protein [Curtobacterium sp. C2H10]|uniref:hypothetical protein n=1 Tax=Curtobacterium sp. C2H10 TaxID=2736664 RepID=UPI0021BFEAA0|nr:hypothetical protein [Curtobacterium sp. C2H10]MCT9622189.1 hypothetical protein [Curtobacterium sp. C2H10]